MFMNASANAPDAVPRSNYFLVPASDPASTDLSIPNNSSSSSSSLMLKNPLLSLKRGKSMHAQEDVDSSNKWTYYDYWIGMLAISNFLVLVVVTVLVSLLLSSASSRENSGFFLRVKDNLYMVAHGWSVTALSSGRHHILHPSASDVAKRKDEELDPMSLQGTNLVLDNRFMESPSTGLFSSVNSPFLCLAVTVMSCAYSMCLLLVRYEDHSSTAALETNDSHSATVYSPTHLTPKMLKSLALLILVCYAVMFLFVQGEWNIPLNNILLVEFLFMASFGIINTFSVHQKHMYFGMRLVNSLFTMPLLAVCVLSMVGEDNTMNLISAYVSVSSALLMILLMNNEDAMSVFPSRAAPTTSATGLRFFPSGMAGGVGKLQRKFLRGFKLREEDEENAVDPSVATNSDSGSLLCGVFVRTFWLCLVPFIVTCSLRFHYMTFDSPVAYPKWSIGCLAFLFAVYMLDGLGWSLHYYYYVCYSASSVGNDTFSAWSVLLKTIDLIAKYVLVLLVVVGYYLEFKTD